jgi:phosphatidate cytidylyltransferase
MVSIAEMTAILFPTILHDKQNLEGQDEAVAKKFGHVYRIALCMSAGLVMWFTAGAHPVDRVTVGGIVLLVLIAVVPAALSGKGIRFSFMLAACGLFAMSYSFLPWLLIADMTHGPHAGLIVLFLMAVVWAGDTGGYFGGRFFGRHRLAPSISPKKTIEGSAFGLVASALAAIAFNHFVNGAFGTVFEVTAIGVCAGALGQVGDLIESLSKRYGSVKDSGRIFPGHGGLLDRVDALLMAAPVVWIYFNL